ncbi:hypothetical protein [Fibrobacter sp. UWB3]|uniref:hypothetical protein n=1 Tax=Fibrobacter sp. UWB3 TaxID=1964357 RepID=UPI000B522EAB|nr:hypothetical protein [Fibrobacter sp. UWB3]OWV19267.1 hypothetical protein B7991_08420 [Fibrobacter sp. UWB3]
MNKQEYIQSLKDEVKQFHPFLKRLFMAMVNKDVLVNVDYTHGPNEVGADFILIKRDPILDENTAISVIVKTGSLRNALGDVERQIDESKAPRKDINGNNIFVREFWVVTNSTISNNARTLIQDKFKNQNIVFLG